MVDRAGASACRRIALSTWGWPAAVSDLLPNLDELIDELSGSSVPGTAELEQIRGNLRKIAKAHDEHWPSGLLV
jgi:hypothetical protein